jgi:hypothetical protein
MRTLRGKSKNPALLPNRTSDSSRLKPGEIISLRDRLQFLTDGIYKVELDSEEMLHLSLGDTLFGVSRQAVEIVERDLPEPESWLSRQIEHLRYSSFACECALCRMQLAKLEGRGSGEELISDWH